MKPLAYSLLAVSIIITLPWPLLAYLCIFGFDAPFTSVFDELTRYGLVFVYLSYPWGLFVAGARIFWAKYNGENWCTKANVTFLAAPIIHVGALVVFIAICSLFSS